MINSSQTSKLFHKATANTPDWSANPTNFRWREDIPNARNTDAGKEIARQSRFLGGLGGLGLGVLVGAIGGLITLAAVDPHLSDAATAGSVAGVAGASTLGGLALGAVTAHKVSKINLAEAELGIKTTSNPLHNAL